MMWEYVSLNTTVQIKEDFFIKNQSNIPLQFTLDLIHILHKISYLSVTGDQMDTCVTSDLCSNL